MTDGGWRRTGISKSPPQSPDSGVLSRWGTPAPPFEKQKTAGQECPTYLPEATRPVGRLSPRPRTAAPGPSAVQPFQDPSDDRAELALRLAGDGDDLLD